MADNWKKAMGHWEAEVAETPQPRPKAGEIYRTDEDELPRYRGIRLMGKCEHCGMPLPLLGPLRESPCNHCQETHRLPDGFWGEFLDALDDNWEIKEWFGGMEVDVKRSEPPKELIEELMGSAFEPPEWIQSRAPTVRRIIGALQEGESGEVGPDVDEAAAHPVAMSCPKCGAGLEITAESPRCTTCDYCKTEVYLPDTLWLKLHPIKKAKRWYVEYRGPSRATRARRRAANDHLDAINREAESKQQADYWEKQRKLEWQSGKLVERRQEITLPRFHFGYILFAVVLSVGPALAVPALFGDSLFGLQAALVCPTVCDTCTGPFDHKYQCRSDKGPVPPPGGETVWIIASGPPWFLPWLVVFGVWVSRARSKVRRQWAEIDAEIADLRQQADAWRALIKK